MFLANAHLMMNLENVVVVVLPLNVVQGQQAFSVLPYVEAFGNEREMAIEQALTLTKLMVELSFLVVGRDGTEEPRIW